MDFAAKNEDILPSTTSLTHGIELCECPSQYSSSSCQNPSIGYYRYFENNRTVPVSTIIIDVIGEAAKCECNGLSTVCDINTGTCQVHITFSEKFFCTRNLSSISQSTNYQGVYHFLGIFK